MLTINVGFCRSKLCPRFSKKFFTTFYVSFLEPITSKPLIAVVKSDCFDLINYEIFEAKNDVVFEYTLTIDHEIYTALMLLVFSRLGSVSHVPKLFSKTLAELESALKLENSKSLSALKKQLESKMKATYELV